MDRNQKLQLQYPTEWVYKIIGTDIELLKSAACSILHERAYSIEESNESKSGKYISLNVKLVVNSDEERTELYSQLGQHKDIKIVL